MEKLDNVLPRTEQQKWLNSASIVALIFALLCFLATPLLLSIEASDFTFFFLCSTFFGLIALATAQYRLVKFLALAVGILACAGAAVETSRSAAGISILENAALNCGTRDQNLQSIEQIRAELRWAISASNAAQSGRALPPAAATSP